MGTYLERGNAKYSKGDYKGAIEEYSKAIKQKPDDPDAYINRGSSKDSLGDHERAIQDYTQAIERRKNFATAYYNRGNSKSSLKDYTGAIEDYSQAIRIKRDYATAYINRGISKHQLKDYNGAIEDYNLAIELNPNDADAYKNRGISKKFLKEYKRAIEDYSLAIQLNPNDAGAYIYRGNSKDLLKDHKGAIQDYNLAIKLNPNNAVPYYNRGSSKQSLNDYKGAIEDYNSTIKLNPNDADAYNNRGISKKQLKDYIGAQSDFLTALQLRPYPSPLEIFNLANLQLEMSKKEEALKIYEEGVKIFKKETEANLKIKFMLSDGNINHIKYSIQNFEKLAKQAELIKQQARKSNRTDVLQQLVKVNAEITSASIKSADKKADESETRKKVKALEEQLKELRKIIEEHSKRIDTVQRKVDQLEAKVEQMGKYIYAEKKILDTIDQIDSRSLSEFYRLLYSMLINHFMAYRMLSTGFFSESVREVTTFDSIAGKVCKAQPIIKKIPILGDLVGIPFQILEIVREAKSNRLNSVIADKINGSRLQSEARITSYISHLIEALINNKAFNTELIKSIQDKEASFLNKAIEVLGQFKEKIYAKAFGGSTVEFSYVQQVVTLYVARFTIQLYDVKKDEFQQHCKSQESFSDFFMKIF